MKTPKMVGPWTVRLPTRIPAKPMMSSTRNTIASATGAPTTRARKIVRRDQSIWPTDRSKTRAEAVSSDDPRRTVPASLAESATSLHQVMENGLQVVVRRGDLVHLARFARGRQLGQPRVERVGPGRLHHHRVLLQ